MNQAVENVEVLEPTDAAEQAAYDEARGVAQAAEQEVKQPGEEQKVATETPPPTPEPEVEKDELADLRGQVEKMSDVFKRLDDVNGRYGRLSQRVEEMQQKIAVSTTSKDVAANTTDAKELMADLRNEFPELADKLEGAFSKVMSSKGGVDQEALSKAVKEVRAAEVKAETEYLEAQLDDLHPGWEKIAGSKARGIPCSDKFAEWIETLPKRDANRIHATRDPFYIAEMFDKHNEWLKQSEQEKPPATPPAQPTQPTQPANQASKKRIADAVMPKGANAPLSATQISEQEAYDKARAEARRIKR